ncbi:MAG: hypothetical protein JWQ13_4072 [Ramlibacter sp.]|nr:hypothetical protein [Ramlibacter sp.]
MVAPARLEAAAAGVRTLNTALAAELELLAAYDFGVDRLHDEEGVLRLVARLEQGAVGTYLSAIPQFPGNRDLSNVAARILGDEAMHCAVLRQAPVFMV